MGSNAVKLTGIDLPTNSEAVVINDELDLLALRLDGYEGIALNVSEADVSLLQSALIAFLDYEPVNNNLSRKLDGIAGFVSKVTETHFTVATEGCEGMSGSPVLVQSGKEFQLVGLYTGTPRKSPFTKKVVVNYANVVKLRPLLRDL